MKAKKSSVHSALSDFDLVDNIGIAKAASALARKKEEELLAELKVRYPNGASVPGGFYDASVSVMPGKETLDKEYVKSHMHPNTYRHALKVGESYLAVNVSAKKRVAA